MTDPITQSMMQGAAGAGGDGAQWIDEVFDIWTYKGTNANHKRTSSVDNTKGGMIMWAPRSGGTGNRYLYDTVRGKNMSLYPDDPSDDDNRSGSPDVASFDDNGYTLTGANINSTTYTSVMWNYRKAPGFFDFFEYTGTGADNNIINHKLKALPGLIIVKRIDAAGDWVTVFPWTGGTEYAFGSDQTQFAWNNNNLPYSVSAFSNIADTNTVNVSRLQWHVGNGTFDFAAADTNASGATYMCYIWAMGSNDGTTDAAIYGENNDQTIISCGIYQGDGSSNRLINLGWEPQLVMYRRVFGAGDDWQIYDAQRGVVSAEGDQRITLNSSGAESSEPQRIDFEGDGLRIKSNNGEVNDSSGRYFYMAIRRSEGIVGKPAEAGTDVFAMDTGAGSSTIPNFDSGFSVDMAFNKHVTSNTENWFLCSRLTQGYQVFPSDSNAQSAWSAFSFDSNVGWNNASGYASLYYSWMFKRHAGFDVATYVGNGNNTNGANAIPHSLGKTPEMIWIKTRNGGAHSGNTHWTAGHKDLNGGTNAWQYTLMLNEPDSQNTTSNFGNTSPTSTHFYVGEPGNGRSNNNGANYLAMLFASVDGISKVGTYDGSSSDVTITTGFQPRFVLIKAYNNTRGWTLMDTLRGWGAGVDNKIYLDATTAQTNAWNYGAPTSTGFTVSHSQYDINYNGWKYIYYAHA